VLRVLFALVLLLLAGVVLLPSPVEPEAWSPPPPPPLEGPLAPNEALRDAALIAEGTVHGPEDLAFDRQGRLYAATAEGKVKRLSADGKLEDFATTAGRPLGIRFDARGNLIACDLGKGLVSIDPAGRVSVLTTEAEGVPFAFIDNLDVASDGSIYFSDASARKAVRLFHQALRPGGYLFLGHAESLSRITDAFTPVRFQGAMLYQKPEAA